MFHCILCSLILFADFCVSVKVSLYMFAPAERTGYTSTFQDTLGYRFLVYDSSKWLVRLVVSSNHYFVITQICIYMQLLIIVPSILMLLLIIRFVIILVFPSVIVKPAFSETFFNVHQIVASCKFDNIASSANLRWLTRL